MDNLLTIILIVLYIYMILSTIPVLLLENRNPVRSLSWIIVLVLIPVFGILLYLLIGQNYRKQKIISKKRIRHGKKLPYAELHPEKFPDFVHYPQHLNLVNLLHHNSDAGAYSYNDIQVFSEG